MNDFLLEWMEKLKDYKEEGSHWESCVADSENTGKCCLDQVVLEGFLQAFHTATKEKVLEGVERSLPKEIGDQYWDAAISEIKEILQNLREGK